jgi:hypothetical protein
MPYFNTGDNFKVELAGVPPSVKRGGTPGYKHLFEDY